MIYTFYSYKGGVGRSMAMANVAEYLYLKGLRVVMIDWDLEAPGLETFFHDTREEKGAEAVEAVRSRLGLIDLLISYKQQFPAIKFTEAAPPRGGTEESGEERESTEEEKEEAARELFRDQVQALRKQLEPISQHLFPLRPKDSNKDFPEAALWLMSAGWRAGERFTGYAQAVQGFDWTDFYVSYRGKAFFEWMREELEAISDVILIDSRTGVTEMGGVCTRQLANVVVSCTVLNNQNMKGVSKMIETFNLPGLVKAREGRRLNSIVVPTRIDTNDTDTRAALIEVFQETFKPEDAPAEYKRAGTNYFETAIPYISKYAYAERLAIGATDYSIELQKAYRSLAAHLALFAPEDSPMRARLSNDLVEFRIVPRRVPAMAPALPPSYAQRREELKQLREALVGEGARVVALCGPPGSGKSTLAAATAADPVVKDAFRDGVLWLTLGGQPDLRGALAGVYTNLTNETRTFSSAEEALKLVGENIAGRRCLFVVDDAFRHEQVAPLLGLSRTCSYLITTRDKNLASELHARIITIGPFTWEEALEYLASASNFPAGSRDGLGSLVERLGTSPFVLKLAGEELRRRIESLNDDPSNAIAHAHRLLDENGIFAFDQPKATDPNKSVALSISHSLDMLSPEELEQYVRLALLLGDEEAGIERVSEIWGMDQASGAGGRASELEAEGRLQRLHALTLLDYDVKRRRVRLDRLIRSYALERLPANTALDVKAEIAFSLLGRDEQERARRVLTRLAPVAAQGASGVVRRRRERLGAFGEADRKVIEKLTAAGVLAADDSQGEQMVMLTDASLAQKWERLRRWIDADRDFLLWRQRLSPGVREWARGRRGLPLRGVELAAARAWVEKRRDELDPAELSYIQESAQSVSAMNRRRVLLVAAAVVVAAGSIFFIWTSQQKKARAAELLRQGTVSARAGDYDTAIRDFDEAISLFPDNARYYNERGLAYISGSKGDFGLALDDFNKAVELDPRYAEAYYNRGMVRRQFNDKERAAADFSQVLTLTTDPGLNASAQNQLNSLVAPTPTPSSALGNVNTNANANRANANNTNTSANANANQTAPHVSNRVYINYSDPADMKAISVLQSDLSAAGLKQVVTQRLAGGPRSAEVHYYYDADAETARQTASIVSHVLGEAAGGEVGVRVVPLRPSREGTGHIEIWLPPLKGTAEKK